MFICYSHSENLSGIMSVKDHRENSLSGVHVEFAWILNEKHVPIVILFFSSLEKQVIWKEHG